MTAENCAVEHAEASRKQSTSYHEGTAGSDASAALASLPKNRLVFTPAMLATGVSAMRFRGPYSPPSFPGSRPDSRIAEDPWPREAPIACPGL